MENEKVLPFPTALSTHICPLCISMNSLQSMSPRPVPISLFVPFVFVFSFMSNNLASFSFFIPTPVSDTEKVIPFVFSSVFTVMDPFSLVNLIAFEI